MSIQNVSDRERYVQEQFNLWNEKFNIPFEHEYELKKYFELQHQYDNTPDEHVKTKRELLDMMNKLKYHLPRLKPKLNNELYEKLLKASVTRQLVEIYSVDRCTGKTSTLIKFAKEFDIAVAVPFSEIAEKLRGEYGYERIYGLNELKYKNERQIVIDEGIDMYKLRELTESMKLEIVTGFIEGRFVNAKKLFNR
ncbi:hypothetical protein EDM57_04325 [Brevibacillus gelatini]|uniref:Uncharacterized protein n=1 Tax=Brevibacillus gelatini TaxID=1655277 RepID=A0A3M8B960_9BACL|nr:hypothetical protein [Brevibacillus gelatini]RNB59375.1 hypothetical protein EDM57_04325 [Brevibacillus gelatini]